MPIDSHAIDVTIIGAGLAGMAASIHLARAGFTVACIEPDIAGKDPVGESLDWSAPDLLGALDLPMHRLLEEEVATYKRHVILKLRNGAAQHYIPSDWLGRPPFSIELKTIHVDRTRLNRLLREMAVGLGVQLIADKAVAVERDGQRVAAVVTENGVRFESPWFLDSSGSAASLFPRAFQRTCTEYGPHKVALWDYFSVEKSIEGTTLLADCDGPVYLQWVWQIPVQADVISVGCVTTGETIKEKRQRGMTIGQIYAEQCEKFTDLREILAQRTITTPRTTSFRCRFYNGIAGPNWLVMGEAAAMVDPMTSYGVTGALRHAAEATGLIVRYRHRRALPRLKRAMYSLRAQAMANFFNSGIEKVVYDWPIRNRIGPLAAGDMYTIPAWSMNHLYSRFRPRGVISTSIFMLFLASLRRALDVYYWFCTRSRAALPACPQKS
jgi:menaquinone-9 beta-reductase